MRSARIAAAVMAATAIAFTATPATTSEAAKPKPAAVDYKIPRVVMSPTISPRDYWQMRNNVRLSATTRKAPHDLRP